MLFSFIQNSLSGASSRFITYSLGKKNLAETKKTFNSIITIHYIIALLVFIFAETLGLWFVLEKMVIPLERLNAAFWVYQCSVLSSVIMIASAPFNAIIIAYEKMKTFAYISIIEVILKLVSVLILYMIPYDLLIIYASFQLIIQIFVRYIYVHYCKQKFQESHYKLQFNKLHFSKILRFAGWTMSGNIALIGCTQGVNILLNVFFGPILNASYGIADQMRGASKQLAINFQTAVRPQITKSYAQHDLNHMHHLILATSRYSFWLMLLLALPMLIDTGYILQLWLGEVPPYTESFMRIMIVIALCNVLSNPLIFAIHATGDLRNFQLVESFLLLLVPLIAYVVLKYTHIPPIGVLIIYAIMEFFTQVARILIVLPKINMLFSQYMRAVILPISKTGLLVWIFPYLIFYCMKSDSFFALSVVGLSSLLSIVLIVCIFGLNNREKYFLSTFLKLRK